MKSKFIHGVVVGGLLVAGWHYYKTRKAPGKG